MAIPEQHADKVKPPDHAESKQPVQSDLGVTNKDQLNQAVAALEQNTKVSPNTLDQFPNPTIQEDDSGAVRSPLAVLVIPEIVKDIAAVIGGIVGLVQLGQMGWEALKGPMEQLAKGVSDMVKAAGNPDNVGAALEKLNPPEGQYPRFVVHRDKEGHVTDISFAADKDHVFPLYNKDDKDNKGDNPKPDDKSKPVPPHFPNVKFE